jgi:hypothetical protein
VSHVQTETEAYALDLWSSLRDAGAKVWLDVKMNRQDEDAMREGVKRCDAVVAVLSKSYFEQPFCVKELTWACEYGKPVIPCVPSDLRQYIGQFGGQPPREGAEYAVAAAPEYLGGFLSSINVEKLDRSVRKYWEVGVDFIRNAERKTIPLDLPDGITLQDALNATLTGLKSLGATTAAGVSMAEETKAAVVAATAAASAAPSPAPPKPGAVYAYVAVQRPPVLVEHRESYAAFASCVLGFKDMLQEQEDWRKNRCVPVSINDGGRGRAR